MKNYTYQNNLIGKKQLKQLLGWSFTNYDSMQASFLADELKYLGFQYASQSGISISIEDLKIPFVKNLMLEKANVEIISAEKIYLKGKITDIERFQKIIDTWNLTSESLKTEIIHYFKNYDPLNSVYIMAFSGARGNLSQVRQLVGMRGLMSDPNGEIMKLPIKKNFREGLTITDYLMSGYGARKGIIDTALKTANSGYLTRRLIDVAQDILVREKDCLTKHSFLISISDCELKETKSKYNEILGRVLNKDIFDPETNILISKSNTEVTPKLIEEFKHKQIKKFYVRSPLTCNLYRAICQKCYGWDLANEILVDIGEAVGILAGQSIGEPGTQLTMRTFHTGGIFTSEARQQIISPITGIIRFHKTLKTVILRTNRGEDVNVTKNSGSLILISDNKNQKLIQIEVLRNTILFPKNDQYVLKNTVIGELINTNKQIKTEIESIVNDKCGEIFMPRLKRKVNLLNNNKLIWILSGELYHSPNNSFINFYPDYKLNRYSYIFRTKIMNHFIGVIESYNNKRSLYQRLIRINTSRCLLLDSKFHKLALPIQYKNYLLKIQDFKYLLAVEIKNSKFYLQRTINEHFGTLITNSFKTLTGGTIYYNQNLLRYSQRNINIDTFYINQFLVEYHSEENEITIRASIQNLLCIYFQIFRKSLSNFYSQKEINRSILEKNIVSCIKSSIILKPHIGLHLKKIIVHTPQLYDIDLIYPILSYNTLIWLGEETHKVNYEQNSLLVEHGDLISEGFEIIPNIFSKTSGIVTIRQKNNLTQIVLIKSGLVYEGKKFKIADKKIYYPGELIFSNISIKLLSFCEHIIVKSGEQLLIRPIELYEVPRLSFFQNKLNFDLNFQLQAKSIYLYKSNKIIKALKNLSLISNVLVFKTNKSLKNDIHIELISNKKTNSIGFQINEKLYLNNHISPCLKYKNLKSSFLVQKNQFVDIYTNLGYLEAVTLDLLKIVKFKIKSKYTKQIFLISNTNCLILQKDQFPKKKLNDFIINSSNINETGKIIIENNNFFTLQKGKPYFFPKCKNNDLISKTDLQYKLIPSTFMQSHLEDNNKYISLNYYKKLKYNCNYLLKNKITIKLEFSKFFYKKNGKLYSSVIPQFFKKFSINNVDLDLKLNQVLPSNNLKNSIFQKINRTLLIQNSEILKNKYKQIKNLQYELTLVNFIEHHFTKSIGLHSITEDYFEQDVNNVFCKDGEFIEEGKTIGLLNLEKEITGDIVQGLPLIEEILEARKKNLLKKRIPTNKKKGLLIQKTGLDLNFDFRKLGTIIKENDKINPHKLLKVYFNYYGLMKSFLCDRTKTIKYNRLINNYEGSYKSFKKIQSFILSSVQSVYQSQGVLINNKHLEVIIKQMTTKVLITYEGKTTLVRREVIDLYHIQYINQIIKNQKKQPAYYVPFLLGITKASLNNPSFISAASFQETTRVLTKAAIEGRIDWLRGLKENIIIGHLIPSGTGSYVYKDCFKTYVSSLNSIKTLLVSNERSRQVS